MLRGDAEGLHLWTNRNDGDGGWREFRSSREALLILRAEWANKAGDRARPSVGVRYCPLTAVFFCKGTYSAVNHLTKSRIKTNNKLNIPVLGTLKVDRLAVAKVLGVHVVDMAEFVITTDDKDNQITEKCNWREIALMMRIDHTRIDYDPVFRGREKLGYGFRSKSFAVYTFLHYQFQRFIPWNEMPHGSVVVC